MFYKKITKEVKQELSFIISARLRADYHDYEIHKIKVRPNRLTLWLGRPGIFIGKAGLSFNIIQKELNKTWPKMKIKLIEYNPLYSLLS